MSISIADAVNKALADMQKQIDELKAQLATRSVTTTTPLLLTVQDFLLLSFSIQSPKQSTKIMFTFIRGIENECNLQ